MIIKEIKIENFKSYYQFQRIVFTEGLNIISGAVGTGKTNLFEAFQWILLDPIYLNLGLKDRMINQDYLLNKKYESECLENNLDNANANISLVVLEDSNEFTIEKSAKFIVRDGTYVFDQTELVITSKNSETGETIVMTGAVETTTKLKSLFPENLRRYLLFKGEDLTELIDFSNSQTLQNAVDKISYLPIFERVRIISNKLAEKSKRKYNSVRRNYTKNQEDWDATQREIDAERKNIESLDIDAKQKEVVALKAEEKKLISKLEFLAGFPELKLQKNEAEHEFKSILRDRENLNEKQKEKFIDRWILLNSENLFETAENSLNEFKQYRKNELNIAKDQLDLGIPGDDVINKIIKEKTCLICGHKFKKDSTEHKHVIKHLDENKEVKNVLDDEIESKYEKVLEISNRLPLLKQTVSSKDIKDDISRIQKEKNIIKERQRVKNLVKAELKDKIHALIQEKGFELENLNNRNISLTLKNCQESLDQKQRVLNSYEERKRTSLEKLQRLERKLNNLTPSDSTNHEKSVEKLVFDILTEFESASDGKIEVEKRELVLKIENSANGLQKKFVENRPDLVRITFKLDDDYQLRFYDEDGNDTHGHGAQQTAAQIAIIGSILKLSADYNNESFPIILDAPTSTFDETFMNAFFEGMHDNFKQCIMILKDIDQNIDDYRKLKLISSIHRITKEKIGDIALMDNSYSKVEKIK